MTRQNVIAIAEADDQCNTPNTLIAGTLMTDDVYFKTLLEDFDGTPIIEKNDTLTTYSLNLMETGKELFVTSDPTTCPITESKPDSVVVRASDTLT